MAPIRVIDREVHVARQRTSRTDFQYALETGDVHLCNVHRGNDRSTGHGGVIDTRCALLPIRRNLADQTERKAVHKPELEEIVQLWERGRRHDPGLGWAPYGVEILPVRGQEQAVVVEPERVGRAGEEAQLDPGA